MKSKIDVLRTIFATELTSSVKNAFLKAEIITEMTIILVLTKAKSEIYKRNFICLKLN